MTSLPAQTDQLASVAKYVLEQARSSGATEADVLVAEGDSVSVQVRLSDVDRLAKAREKSLGLRVFFNKRSASTSTSDFSKKSLNQFVSDTCALAKAVAEDQMSGLPESYLTERNLPDLEVYDPTQLTVEEEISLARRAEKAAMSVDQRITNSEGADCAASHGTVVLANSHGFVGVHQSSTFSLSVSPIATDSKGKGMQRDYWYSVNPKLERLDSPESIGKEAARRTVRRLGAQKVSTQEVPVIFDSETSQSLLGHLASAISGYSLYKGASFLLGQLGKRLAPEFVNIYDDGRLLGGLGSRHFDGEGIATRKTPVLEGGILTNYLLDTYSGRKLGMESTGNASRSIGDNPTVGVTNFYLVPGRFTPTEIISSVRQGLYVTELIGFGVNMVTGDYSRGVVGFWIKDGELAYPVEEVTIAGNVKQMFADIEMIGNDLEFRGRMACPTLKIRNMMVAGN